MHRDTLSEVQRWLAGTGFTEDLIAEDGALRSTPSGRVFAVGDLVVSAVYRFEGQTDPADEAILFALETPAGEPVGTFTAPYGPAVSATDEAVIDALHERAARSEQVSVHAAHDHIAAVFATRDEAEAAVTELREHGLGSEHLGVAVHGPAHIAFEHDEESDLAHDAEVATAAGASLGFLAGMALAAFAVPGLGVLGVGGLFAVGAASGFGGAMLGGFLGIAAADREFTEHEELSETPLDAGEVLVAVRTHGQPDTVRATMQRHGGRLLNGRPAR